MIQLAQRTSAGGEGGVGEKLEIFSKMFVLSPSVLRVYKCVPNRRG